MTSPATDSIRKQPLTPTLHAKRAQNAAPMFAALGDPTRLQLLMRLAASGPESIAQMSEKSVVTRQAITRHLQVLSEAGFVAGERRGREHIWRVQPRRFRDVQVHLERISRHWDDALARLRKFIQE
jgi:DNA-binding transcriptional ArsR family regulator